MPEEMWFIRDKGQVRGPFSRDHLLQLHRRGQLARFVEVSQDRLHWVKSAQFLEANGSTTGMSVPKDYSQRAAPAPGPAPSIPAQQTPAYQASWPVAPENSGFAGDRPRSKTSTRLKWAAILAVPLVLIAMSLTIVTYLLISKGKTTASFLNFGHSIHSTLDQDNIAASVGLVIVGFEFKRPNGEHGEKPLMTGSCFAITEDGSALTNRHVVEFYDQMVNASELDQRRLLYINLILDQVPAANREKARQELLKKDLDEFRFSVLDPKIWIFFTGNNGRPVKKTASLTYLSDASEYDFAILKVDRAKGVSRSGPYFRLANSEKKLRRGDSVVALGFPGTTRNAVSPDEQVEELVRKQLASRVESIYKDRDFEYVRTAGEVSLDFVQKSGRRWIQHNAAITHGNSGGPLVNPQGLVVGINTQGAQDGSTFQALSIVQLKELIQEKVPNVVFSDQ